MELSELTADIIERERPDLAEEIGRRQLARGRVQGRAELLRDLQESGVVPGTATLHDLAGGAEALEIEGEAAADGEARSEGEVD